jgi:hypothetical protein
MEKTCRTICKPMSISDLATLARERAVFFTDPSGERFAELGAGAGGELLPLPPDPDPGGLSPPRPAAATPRNEARVTRVYAGDALPGGLSHV